jgi:hypothetical protein
MLSKKSKLSEPSPPIYIEDKIYQLVFTGTNSCDGCVFYENNREICYKVDENKFDNIYIYANDIDEANSLYNKICARYKKGMNKITFG